MNIPDGPDGRLAVGITGASGSIYALRFLERVIEHYGRIYLTVTDNANTVMRAELGIDLVEQGLEALLGFRAPNVDFCSPHDMTAPPASGSVPYDGLVIIPCSVGTVGRIAAGVSNDLVTRVADVCLKERRKLILVVRETPLSVVHLRNLTFLAEAGAVVLPAAPGFYLNPKSVEDLVSFVVDRTLQQLGLPQSVAPEWEAPGI